MKPATRPLPGLGAVAAGLTVLILASWQVPGLCAQQKVAPAGEGTHLFRRIFDDALVDLKALTSPEELLDDPEHTILIVLGETSALKRLPLPLDEFVKIGGAALVAT